MLYVGKSVSVRARARAHFAPSAHEGAWVAQADDGRPRATYSELGALRPGEPAHQAPAAAGQRAHEARRRYVYLRCRLDIPFPMLEVAPAPAAGRAVTSARFAGGGRVELVEQLNSLFGLRHCGRGLPRRDWPCAYGQMGRCLSPCLGDLDPNLYRRRLDEALALFTGPGDGGAALLAHVDSRRCERAAAERAFERAAWLRRRAGPA